MGYRPDRKIFKLVFAESEYEGLIVRARSTSLGMFLDIQEKFQTVQGNEMESLKTLLALFADVLVSWNLEDEHGQEIAPSLEALLAEDLNFVMVLVSAWVEAMTGAAGPLDLRSTPGSPPPVASIPMETLSSSLVS